ncbi:MAG TPA: aminopeptidase P family N-terminal domain-containing protein, partial [Longilinea sp.]|nr:aminopeptidase P family N-terminal domain-containing protein [Longilinea sp.]
MNEIDQKITLLRNILVQNHLDGILLQRNSSFSWVTGGFTGWVNSAGSFGEVNLLVTAEKVLLITNNIEAPRLHHEMDVEKHGWEIIDFPWQAQG